MILVCLGISILPSNLSRGMIETTIVKAADKALSNPFDVSNTSGLIFVLDRSAKAGFIEL